MLDHHTQSVVHGAVFRMCSDALSEADVYALRSISGLADSRSANNAYVGCSAIPSMPWASRER